MAEALFDCTGSMIFVSQARGTIAVLDAKTLRHLDLVKASLEQGQLASHVLACIRKVACKVACHTQSWKLVDC